MSDQRMGRLTLQEEDSRQEQGDTIDCMHSDLRISRMLEDGTQEVLTRCDDRHIDEDMRPDLPIEQRLPDMPHLKMLLFAHGRVVVLCKLKYQ